MSSRGEKGEEGHRKREWERERGRGRKQTRGESGSKRVSVKEGSLTAQKKHSANSVHSLSQWYSEHGELLSSRKQFSVQRDSTETSRNRGSGVKREEERFFVERWTQILGIRVKESSLQVRDQSSRSRLLFLKLCSQLSGGEGERRHVLLLFSLTHLRFTIVLIFLTRRDSLWQGVHPPSACGVSSELCVYASALWGEVNLWYLSWLNARAVENWTAALWFMAGKVHRLDTNWHKNLKQPCGHDKE